MRRGGLVLLLASACGASGRLTGSVAVALGDPSQATVVAQGPVTSASAVGSDGTYEIDGLPNGTYQVVATAPWTWEASASARAVVAGGVGTVPGLLLTGTGQVVGRVAGPADVSGAEVFIAQTSARQTVGSDGTFSLDAPAGTRTVSAVLAGYAPATQAVSVVYAQATSEVTLTLSATAGSGGVEGHAYYFDRTDHSGITVTADGTSAATVTAPDGSFLLQGVPPGSVTLRYAATGYASADRAGLVVGAGIALPVPDVRLYLAEQRFSGRVHGDRLYPAPDGSRALFVGSPASDPGTSWLCSVPLSTSGAAQPLDRLVTAADLQVTWQADGKKAAVQPQGAESNRLWAVDAEAGKATALTDALAIAEPWSFGVATDQVFFLETDGGSVDLGVFSFATSSTQRLGAVDPTPQRDPCGGGAWLPGTWPQRAVQLSVQGQAAYRDATGLELFVHGAPQRVSSAADCFAFAGEQLVGGTLAPNASFFTLDAVHANVLLSGGAVATLGGFTGDGAYVWMESPYEAYTVWMAPLDGGAPSPFLPMPSPYQLMTQPGGSEWVAYGPGVKPALSVVSPVGGLLRTYSSGTPSSAQVGAFFSPLGRWLVVMMEPDGVLSVADAQTQTPRVLQGQPLSVGPGAFVRFSPGESALAFTAAVDGGCRSELVQLDGGVLAAADTGCSSVDAWVEMDPSDQWAFIRGPTDQVISLSGGPSMDLGRAWAPLDGAPSFFTGDGRRLALRESVSPPSRVFSADPRSGQLRYVADDDGAWIGAMPSSRALILIEDAARAPPGVSAVQPPGLYVLAAP